MTGISGNPVRHQAKLQDFLCIISIHTIVPWIFLSQFLQCSPDLWFNLKETFNCISVINLKIVLVHRHLFSLHSPKIPCCIEAKQLIHKNHFVRQLGDKKHTLWYILIVFLSLYWTPYVVTELMVFSEMYPQNTKKTLWAKVSVWLFAYTENWLWEKTWLFSSTLTLHPWV